MRRAHARAVEPETPPAAVRVLERKRYYGEGLGAELVTFDSEPLWEETYAFRRHVLWTSLANASVDWVGTLNGRKPVYRGRRETALFLAAADRVTMTSQHRQVGAQALNIAIDPQAVAGSLEEEGSSPSVELVSDLTLDDVTVLHLTRLMERELESGGLLGELYLDSIARLLVLTLLRRTAASDPFPQSSGGGLDERRLRRVLDYLADHIAEDVRLGDLVAQANLSRAQFLRCFRRSVGTSPHQYLLRLRIERASSLLLSTRRDITQIALSCGFSTPEHFSRVFKRETGNTPSRYRQLVRG